MGAHTHKHTHIQRTPLRHAATIWFDSPCCCLDLPYFNCWWLHTGKSSWAGSVMQGISTGIFWGPFAGGTRHWLRACLWPDVSKSIFLVASFNLSETDKVEHASLEVLMMKMNESFWKSEVYVVMWLLVQLLAHPCSVNNSKRWKRL